MGLCASAEPGLDPKALKETQEQNRKIEIHLQAETKAAKNIHKLLLLGAGESGKSTLFKQVNSLYGKSLSEEERRSYTNAIRNNTIQAMKMLVDRLPVLAQKDPKCILLAESDRARAVLDATKQDDKLTVEVATAIADLWRDPGIRAAFAHKSLLQIPDSVGYFFDRVVSLASDSYVPSEEDVLRVRVRTTGIVVSEFVLSDNKFQICDVGGQRNERKKWMHCFQGVTAVIFVVGTSEYDQMLYEDETTNRMIEALNLFDETVNSKFFRDTSFILFLNKKDLFAEKIKSVPLTVCFPEYNGPEKDVVEGLHFLAHKFESLNKNADGKVQHQLALVLVGAHVEN